MSDSTGVGPAKLDLVAEVVTGPPRGARRAPVVGAALLLLVVLPLGLAVHAGWQPLLHLDRSVSDALVVPGRGRDVDVLRVLTAAGLLKVRFVVLVPLAIWLVAVRRWQLATFVVVAGFGVSPVNGLLKILFGRQRPSYDDTIDVGGLSFPSGHSSGAAALAAILVIAAWPLLVGGWRRVWVALAALVTTVVGYTRIALGAHFLSDVIAGWSYGIAWVLLLAALLQVWPGQPGAFPRRRSVERP
jgi:membrane-associated phospholipid phosphatase